MGNAAVTGEQHCYQCYALSAGICCQLTADCGQVRTYVRQMYGKCYPIGSLLETDWRISNVPWGICPDIRP